MTISKVGIANLALNKLGQSAIASFTEDNARALAVNLVYDISLDTVLRTHRWNFALKRASLTRLSDTPPFGFSYYYQLPGDFVRLARMELLSSDFRIEGDRLLSDSDTAKIIYVHHATNTNLYDPLFVQAFVHRLAADLARQLTGSIDTVSQMEQLSKLAIDEARYIDSLESPDLQHEPSNFVESRVSGDTYRPISDTSS